jgi:N-acetyl sugar amidotransferase
MLLRCPKCHYPLEHPLGLTISEKECSGCFTHKEKDQIDWTYKAKLLEDTLKGYKKNRRQYDCVVPVVGDAEDYYTLTQVLSLGLSPLVVCVNDYFKNNLGWHNLHNLITHFDVDSLVFNPDLRAYKDLIRTSIRKFDHMMLPFHQLHTSFPVHIAHERNIPLVIWGQNQAVEQVGKFSHHDAVEMSRWNRREHDLFNVETDKLIGNGAQVDERELNYYQYPKIQNLSKRNVRGIFLSNYMRWDPLVQNHSMTEYDFMPEENVSTFDIYERAGSSVYYQIHDLLKMKRVGYRKSHDHVVREIRHGRITSEQGAEIINHYSNSKVSIKPFFDWLGVTNSGYEWYVKHKLNGLEHLLEYDGNIQKINLPKSLTSLLVNQNKASEQFVTFGKGIFIG